MMSRLLMSLFQGKSVYIRCCICLPDDDCYGPFVFF